MVSEQGLGQGSADPAGLTSQLHFPGVGPGVSCLTAQGLSFLLCEMEIIKHLAPKGVRKMKQAKAPATKPRARLEGVGEQWLFLGGLVVAISLKAQLGVPSVACGSAPSPSLFCIEVKDEFTTEDPDYSSATPRQLNE